MRTTSSYDTRKIIQLALFTALVVVMQCIPIKIGTFELALSVPIMIIGAAICGPLAGAWLGLVFSVVVLFLPGTAFYLSFNAFGTVLTVILKGTLAGFLGGFFYKALAKHEILAAVVSAIVATVTNTSVFLLGSLLFFEWDIATVIGVFISINFLIEIAINIALVPTITRIISIKKR
jgi:uncharacterized membrane protein